VFVPAAGQGVIAIQARPGTPAADVALAASHAPTMACLLAERAAVRELAASCHAPVGIHAQVVADGLRIRGFAGLPDGSECVTDEIVWQGRLAGAGEDPTGGDDPAAAGAALAGRMIAAGAGELLRAAEAMAT
jgi:hydroxymethylbilane synthase